jgi:hypothetical protein
MRRITEQMVKAKKPNRQLIEKIIIDWIKSVKDIDAETIWHNVFMQLFGALYLDNVDDKTGMDIINTTIDRIALTLFTPKAWEYVKEDMTKDINEHCDIIKIRTLRKVNGDFKKCVKYKVV